MQTKHIIKLCGIITNVPNVHQITGFQVKANGLISHWQTILCQQISFIAKYIHFQCISSYWWRIEQMFTGLVVQLYIEQNSFTSFNWNCTNKYVETKMYIFYACTWIAIKKMPNRHFIAPIKINRNWSKTTIPK